MCKMDTYDFNPTMDGIYKELLNNWVGPEQARQLEANLGPAQYAIG